MDFVQQGLEIAGNPKNTRWICPLLILVDAALCALIIWKIPYTEIDWKAYMEQVTQYVDGERDYVKIKGGTGPLVYPAAHVYVYQGLYHLTERGKDILLAQKIFASLYLTELAVVMQCYRMAKAPPYVFPLLILSKRLHSIFMLRCFNDCFAVGALFVAILAYQSRMWTIGSLVYAWGLGIKMSLLLALPAVGIILLQAVGRDKAIRQALLIFQVQIMIAIPFLRTNAQGYLSRAFELTRQFLYKWTVNWRFVPEETFLSNQFSTVLLGLHLVFLLLFVKNRWLRPSSHELRSGNVVTTVTNLILSPPSELTQNKIAHHISPAWIINAVLSANVVGMLCARSLHYQFYSWLAWSTPLLLWQAGFHPVLQYALWAAQEFAWNVYPSTKVSSGIVVGVLFVQVMGSLFGKRPNAEMKGPRHQHVE